MSLNYHFFATCPRLIEGLLLEELKSLGASACKETLAGVHFQGSLEVAYRACLWSRLANRILLNLGEVNAKDHDTLYRGVKSINWAEHFSVSNTFKVDFSGQSDFISHTQYGAQLVKDAIVDQFREHLNARPNVDPLDPDLRIHAHLQGTILHLSLDLSGESLHRRGYRSSQGEAPIKENLAAAILIRANWAKQWQAFTYLIDPLCGSGTLLIEAAFIALDRAPQLLRNHFGFKNWKKHQPQLWEKLLSEARTRATLGIKNNKLDIRGYDASPRAISNARENIARAGLLDVIDVSVRELSHLKPPTHFGDKPGFIITNPPYGERLGEVEELKPLYQYFGEQLCANFQGWSLALFTGNPDLAKAMGVRAKKNYAFLNGSLPCKLLLFSIIPEWFMRKKEPITANDHNEKPQEYTLPPEAEMFANRLRKNFKALQSWLTKNDIHCYRVYDADMPEYSVAIDCYENYAHVQEYAAPKTVDPQKAAQRLAIVQAAIPAVLNIPPNHIFIKQRREQKDNSQYEKIDNQKQLVIVREGKGKFLVNLKDYLDAGLFLDHRPMRLHLASLAKGKRFLNLFCYTASATVHAALGGAYKSVSVDMSATYTDWAKQNLALNGLSDSLHKVVQMDCLRWLDTNQEQFDLIFLDPPTFSRSKRMNEDFDIQRDHVKLIRQVLKHLAPDGTLFFSNNFRKFELDEAALHDLKIKNITTQTLDKDFARDPKIHHCFEIKQ